MSTPSARSAIDTLTFEQSARYVSVGELGPETDFLWLTCHGYGQLATYFSRKFSLLGPRHHVLVPEGQHRFYLSGTQGRVGASWMTKEDRERDIANQHAYLDAVMTKTVEKVDLAQLSIVAMGFSQGTATICRYLMASDWPVAHLVLWAGMFPEDVDLSLSASRLKETSIYLLHGDEDPYIADERSAALESRLESAGLSYQTIRFSGGHEIPPHALASLVDRITGQGPI